MFEYSFLWIALGVGLLTGGLCAYLGNFVLMKNMTFISIALAEIAALGVAIGAVLGWNDHLMAFALTLLAVLFFWKRGLTGAKANEGIIGVLYVASAALAVLLVAANPLLEAHGLDLINGNLLYCTAEDLMIEGVLCLLLLLLHGLFRKEFLFVAFDLDTARAQGLKAPLWDLLLMLSIGVCIAICMSHAGVLFVFASLVIPGMAALALFQKVGQVFLFSVVFSAVGVLLGGGFSYYRDLPTSPSIICAYAVLFFGVVMGKSLRNRFLSC